ncbi:helix-turn-helix transcriptional regulator [Rhizobium sp. SRDI969]|uniref:helix-turn-helix transcriptional regulator n=1 Tax=Rhizobium sp. SRDI969 TaxID=3138252 RepID=UPI0021A2CAD2|nr:LuxR C-terminal-related transcriptional regulator [Rhizobium leguminosarum]UWM85370.1 LuxR C-terminal-related transcriptional regulator [Rhizobium leguminosarum bv. viciae]
MNIHPPLQLTSKLVAMIYDCVLEPVKWETFVSELLYELNFSYGLLSISAFPEGNAVFGVSVGIEGPWMEKLPGYWADIMEIWGGDVRIQQYPLEEPILQSQITDVGQLKTNPYYSGWFAPQGYIDAVAIGLERNQHMVSSLALGRHATAGPVSEDELGQLRLLAPHLRRAISIAQQLEVQSIAASAYASVVDSLPVGVLLVDELMAIIHANPTAESLLSQPGPFRSAGSRLVVRSEGAAALEQAVARAASDEAALGRSGGAGIPVRHADSIAYVVHVLPLRQRQSRGALCLPASAALFLVPAGSQSLLPSDPVTQLYGLSPAETRIFELIVRGETPKAIAKQLGLSASTIKTHVRNIFAKTGTRRQADFARMAASLRVLL